MATIVTKIDLTRLEELTAAMRPRASVIVRETGFEAANLAAMFAPLDTGALRNSILAESRPTGELSFIVQDGVEYGIHQEFGTKNIPAHPFITPAIEAIRQKFERRWAELFA